jgi:hypothetical protein
MHFRSLMMKKNLSVVIIKYHLYNFCLGPGSYELPPILGKKRIISTIHNTPAFSIGSSIRLLSGNSCDTILEKSNVTNSLLGTPGVGAYHPKFVLPKSPGFVPTTEERFKNLESASEKKLPIMYVKEINLKAKKFGVCFFLYKIRVNFLKHHGLWLKKI